MKKFMAKLLQILGWVIMAGSLLLGLWVAIYLMFYGGIVNIINGFQADPTDAVMIAGGICKIIFCEVSAVIPICGIPIGCIALDKGLDLDD